MKRTIVVLALLAAGCGTPVDAAQSNAERALDLTCECFVPLGHASAEACENSLRSAFEYTDSERRCLDDVVAREDPARNYFECTLLDQEDYLNCLDRANNACDAVLYQQCNSDYAAGVSSCGETHLTASAYEALQECTD